MQILYRGSFSVMEQTLLDDKGKRILDCTCSFAKIWPKHATIRIDIRPETKPDIVMDAKQLDFPNNFFDELYCDPPHFFRKGQHPTEKQKRRLEGRTSPGFYERYGHWNNKEEWNEFVEKTNIEFSRVLKDDGKLFYKLTEANSTTNVSEFIDKMTNFILVEDNVQPSKSNRSNAKTHFLIFSIKGDLK